MKLELRFLNKLFSNKKRLFITIFLIYSVIIVFLFVFHENNTAVYKQDFNNIGVLYFFLMVIFAPIVEEIAFRLPLIKCRYYFSSLIPLCIYLFLGNHILLKVGFVFFIFLIVNSYFNLSKSIRIFLYITSVLLFAFSHLNNYTLISLKEMNMLDISLLVVPQFLLGIILTIVRIKGSFRLSILFHALHNFILVFIIYILLLFL